MYTISLQYLKKRVIKLMFCMLINMKLFYKLILLFLMGVVRHAQNTQASLHSLCDILRKKLGMKLRDLNALTCSNTTPMLYYTSNVLSPLNLMLSQYGIHTKPFLYLINCLLFFQVTLGSYKLVCSEILILKVSIASEILTSHSISKNIYLLSCKSCQFAGIRLKAIKNGRIHH